LVQSSTRCDLIRAAYPCPAVAPTHLHVASSATSAS